MRSPSRCLVRLHEVQEESMNQGVVWAIVGILAIVALLIFILPRLS